MSAPARHPQSQQHDFNQRIPALDGIRGFAFLCVFVCHYMWFNPLTPVQFWVSRVGHSLSFGLDMFFVLSGFLITGILLGAKGRQGYFRNFYMRRTLRILPLYYTALLLCHWDFRWMYPQGNGLFLNQAPWYWAYLFNNHVAFYMSRIEWDQFTIHFWSLGLEEQFYLVWPFVVLFLGRRGLMGVCVSLIVASPLVRLALVHHYPSDISAAYYCTFGRCDGLAMGALLAVLASAPASFARVRRWALPTLVSMLGATVALFFWRGGFFNPDRVVLTVGLTVFPAFALGCVAAVISTPKGLAARFFGLRLFTILGKYSYGLYVWHNLARFAFLSIIDALTRKGAPLRLFIDWGGPSPMRESFVRVSLALILTMTVALLSYHFFEKDFLALKVYFEYTDRRQSAPDHEPYPPSCNHASQAACEVAASQT